MPVEPVHQVDHGLLLMSLTAESVSTLLFQINVLALHFAVDKSVMNFTLYMRFSSILSDILAGQSVLGALRNIENVVCISHNYHICIPSVQFIITGYTASQCNKTSM